MSRTPKEIVAFCLVCKRPRLISLSLAGSVCPGCMRHGTITFDPKINILKIMSKITK